MSVNRTEPPRYTYGLADLRAMLGQDQRSDRWMLGYLARLVEHSGFPLPLPYAPPRGQLAPSQRIVPASRWPAAAVDDWLMGMLPVSAAMRAAAAAETAAAAEMDARANSFAQRQVAA